MTIDRVEASRRGQSTQRKTSTKHPYAAIEHRVIDSPAYADLSFSARALLVQIVRQLTKDNNGHLQATYSYLRRFGFDSEHTIIRAVKELIAHGLICRTRSGGYQQGAAQYAVTWLPIKDREGLFLDGFKSCAWRDWVPDRKKTPLQKMQDPHCKNGIRTPSTTAKNTVRSPAKSADNESMPCSSAFPPSKKVLKRERNRRRPIFAHPLLIKRQVTADRGILLQTPCRGDAIRLVSLRASA